MSNITVLSTLLEKMLLLESRTNYMFGISILCKAKKIVVNVQFKLDFKEKKEILFDRLTQLLDALSP